MLCPKKNTGDPGTPPSRSGETIVLIWSATAGRLVNEPKSCLPPCRGYCTAVRLMSVVNDFANGT